MPAKQFFPPPNVQAGRVFLFWAKNESSLDDLETWLRDENTKESQEKLIRLLRLMASESTGKLHPSEEKFKHEFGKIFAIKSSQIRLYGYFEGNNFCILHFTKKKKQKLSNKDKKTIESRYAQSRAEQ